MWAARTALTVRACAHRFMRTVWRRFQSARRFMRAIANGRSSTPRRRRTPRMGRRFTAAAAGRFRRGSVQSRRRDGRRPCACGCRSQVRTGWPLQTGILGPYAENLARDCGDFIIRRSDGVYAYQLAVVADDAAMGITEVVRGRDLLSSTPRQLYLYRLLGKPAPRFYHIPLLVTAEGRRLSKRDRGMDLGYLRQRGWRPEEILGRLAHLGGLLPSEEAISAYELARLFDWSKVPVENIVVPEDFLNGFR